MGVRSRNDNNWVLCVARPLAHCEGLRILEDPLFFCSAQAVVFFPLFRSVAESHKIFYIITARNKNVSEKLGRVCLTLRVVLTKYYSPFSNAAYNALFYSSTP